MKAEDTDAQGVPSLLTPSRIAELLGVSLYRVQHILRTRPHIIPRAKAGAVRLYRSEAVAQVRHEINAIDARRSQREVCNA